MLRVSAFLAAIVLSSPVSALHLRGGLSNETVSPLSAIGTIPLNEFPFVTTHDSATGYLDSR